MKNAESGNWNCWGRCVGLNVEVKFRRPNVVAIFLWITGIILLILTFYMLVKWQEAASMRDCILFVLAGSSSVTQIAVGALIDMHNPMPRRLTHLNTMHQTQQRIPIHHLNLPKITNRIHTLTHNRKQHLTLMQPKNPRTLDHALTWPENFLTLTSQLIEDSAWTHFTTY